MSDEFIPILTYQSPETPDRNAKGLGDVIFGDPDRTVDPSKTVGRFEALSVKSSQSQHKIGYLSA